MEKVWVVQASDLKIWAVEPERDEVEAGEAFLGAFFKSAKRKLRDDFWVLTPVGLFHAKEKIRKFSQTFASADLDELARRVEEKLREIVRERGKDVVFAFVGSAEVFEFFSIVCEKAGVKAVFEEL